MNMFVPSWLAGTCWNSAVSGSCGSRILPTATPSSIAAPEAPLSVKFTVSRPSSTLSSSMNTETVFSVSPTAKVSVPLAAV